MFEAESADRLNQFFRDTGREQAPGIELALVETDPFMLVNTLDQRLKSWRLERLKYEPMPICDSTFFPDFIPYSALAISVLFLEGPWRNADYVCVNDFFDFMEHDTERWLLATIQTKGLQIIPCVSGYPLVKTPIRFAANEEMLSYYGFCLTSGKGKAAEIRKMIESPPRRDLATAYMERRSAADSTPFETVKTLISTYWPDDLHLASLD